MVGTCRPGPWPGHQRKSSELRRERMAGMSKRTRITYIERKAGELTGAAKIGRVTYSKTGATLQYQGQEFRSLKGSGFKGNYYDVETRDEYWISGP